MGLPDLAHSIRKQLSSKESKKAANLFGLSHFYFTQKIKSIDTDKEDLKKAVEYMVKVHKEKHKVILDLYNEFNNEFEINNPK